MSSEREPQAAGAAGASRWAGFALALALVGALAAATRWINHRHTQLPDRAGWITTDVDSHHLMRRVERVFDEGLPVAGTDAGLAFPDGSAIPAPPYYPLAAWACLAPFAPEDAAERHAWIERATASLPPILSVLTALVVAALGWRLLGAAGALLAGGYFALGSASIVYSASGIADLHAWITLLVTLQVWTFYEALRRGALERPARGLGFGAALGALAGVALGSWVATLLHVLALQLALAWLLLVAWRHRWPGLAWFGIAYHVAALAVLAPAIAASPWRRDEPWLMVGLSWFHVAFLAAGALVFAPLVFLRSTAALRAYPWLVGGALAAAGAWAFWGGSGLAAPLRESVAWFGRTDEYMAIVAESQPLFGAGAHVAALEYVGWGLAAFPLAWLVVAWASLLRGRRELLLVVALAAISAAGAARQTRFAEAWIAPLALTLAAAVAELLRLGRTGAWGTFIARCGRAPRWAWAVVALAAAAVANARTVELTVRRFAAGPLPAEASAPPVRLGVREACEWLRAHASDPEPRGVLAFWSWGHSIQWIAGLPVVASTYGTYVGVDAFREPSRFFLEGDPARAEERLARRRVGWVLATGEMPNFFEAMCATVELDGAELPRDPRDPTRHHPLLWLRGMASRLLRDGLGPEGDPAARPLDFLRQVHVSRARTLARGRGDAQAAARVWERVAGARLEVRGAPGARFEVRFEVRYPNGHAFLYADGVALDGSGVGRLRVPYATDAPNGDARVAAGASWSLDGARAPLAIPERAVLAGETLRP